MNGNFINEEGVDTFPTTLQDVGYPYNEIQANAIPTMYFEFIYRRAGNQQLELAGLANNTVRRIRQFCNTFSTRNLLITPDQLRCDLDWGGIDRVYGDHRGLSTPFFNFNTFVQNFITYIDNLIYQLELEQEDIIYCTFNLTFTLHARNQIYRGGGRGHRLARGGRGRNHQLHHLRGRGKFHP
jgi:hypothetical protein